MVEKLRKGTAKKKEEINMILLVMGPLPGYSLQ
jgi:hypothetical protein